MGLHRVHTTGYKASSDQKTNTQQARQLTPHKTKQPMTPWQINASALGTTSEYVVRAENVITAGCDITTKDVSADVTTGQPQRWGPPWTCWRQCQWPEPGEVSVRDGGSGADADQCRLLDQPGHRQPLHLPVVAAAARHRLIQQLFVSRSQPAAWRLPVHLSGFSSLHLPVSLTFSPGLSVSHSVSTHPSLSFSPLSAPHPPSLYLPVVSVSRCLPLSPSLPPFTPFLSVPPISLSPALSPSSLALLPFPSLPLLPLLSPRSFCLTLCLSLSPLVPLSPFPSLYLPSLTLSPALSPSSLSPLFFSLPFSVSSPLSFSPETTHSAKSLILNAHFLTQDEIFVNSSCENESRVNDYLTDMKMDMWNLEITSV